MSKTETALLNLIKERSFRMGTFKLASGKMSDYYIDGKSTIVSSEGAFLVGEVLFEQTQDLAIEAIGGLEMGAVPLATAAAMAYHQHGRKIEGFWVRDQAKDHGTKKTIEGKLERASRVVIVDDVFTSGLSAFKAVEEVQKLGCEVVLVLALVDRLQGAEQFFQGKGIPFRSVFTVRDLGVEKTGVSAATKATTSC